MGKVVKGLRLLLKYILMYLSMLVPRKKKLVVFGAWLGEKFTDNPKALFLEAAKSNAVRAVWITKESTVLEEISGLGYEVYLWGTFKAIWVQLRASYAVVSNGISDLEHTFLGRAVILDLWHGVPLKKICYDDVYERNWDSPKQRVRDAIIRVPLRKEYYVATSETFVTIYQSAFRTSKDKILCVGQPRNDVFFEKKEGEKLFTGKNVILYCPTHRKEGAEPMYASSLFDLERLEAFLAQYDYYFVIKKHFYHREEVENLERYPHIIDLTATNTDIQKLMMEVKLLITDYSSIYIDYLLLDLPLLFYCYDYERYLSHDREMYFPYDEVTPGKKVRDFDKLVEQLEVFVTQGEAYGEEERSRIKDFFYCKRGQGPVAKDLIQWILQPKK